MPPDPRKPGTATAKTVVLSLLAGLLVLALVIAAVKHIDEIPLGPILPVAFVVAVVLAYRSARSTERTVALSLLVGLLALALVFAVVKYATPKPKTPRSRLPGFYALPQEGLCGNYYLWLQLEQQKAWQKEQKRLRALREKAQNR